MPYLAGFAAWNYADFGSNGRADAIPFVNQKGLLNFDRTEKDVCGLYRAYFSPDPVVYIASHNYMHRAGIENSEGAGIRTDSIKVFSNQEKIELLLNGKTLGQKQVKDHEVNFAVPFKNGKNLLRAVDGNGNSDEITIDYTIIPSHLDSHGVKDLAVNVGSDVSFYDPGAKVLWIADREYTPKAWGYVGGAPHVVKQRQLQTGISQNILGTDCNPLFQTFVEGVKSYRFDAPDGKYKLTLCFQEYVAPNRRNMYNLSNSNASENKTEPRDFDIAVNGQNIVKDLNLKRDYGSLRAVTFDFVITAKDGSGIQVDFQPVTGKALLSGIRIEHLN